MYPEPDQRAEQFDKEWERRHTGEEPAESDAELDELLELAGWLEDNLPDDIPDPVFRANLKQQLLIQPSAPDDQIDLAGERWHRRLTGSAWRLSATAAALAVVLIVSVVLGIGVLDEGGDEPPQDNMALQSADDEDQPQPDSDADSGIDAFSADEAAPDGPRGDASELPPFTTQHVVLNPLLGIPLSNPAAETEPSVELAPEAEMPDLPDSAPIYYLSAPPDPEPILTSIQQTLGLEGEVVAGAGEGGIPYQLVNERGQAIIDWDAGSSYFSYRAEAGDPDYENVLPADAEPEETARAFLEAIGFDLYSIEYETDVEDQGELTRVVFEPADIPNVGMDLSLGAVVDIDGEGTVSEAHGFWFSLTDTQESDLRESEEAWELSQNGEVFWPPHDAPATETLVEIEDARLSYLLTRRDDSTFVLQPAVTFMGKYDDEANASRKKHARCYVPAVDDD